MKNKPCPVCGKAPFVREDKKLQCMTQGCMMNGYFNVVPPEIWNANRAPAFTSADYHSPDEEPDGRTVVVIYNKGKTFELWYSYEYSGCWYLIIKKYGIIAWAYIDDLPKPEGAE